MRDPIRLIDGATSWMTDYAKKASIRTLVVGVSGGIDSTVVERLSENTGLPVIAIAMPMWLHEDSSPLSLALAMQLCVGRDNVDFRIRPIGRIVSAYKEAGVAVPFDPPEGSVRELNLRYKEGVIISYDPLPEGNLRSRIRANILRDAAGRASGCVVGTGNYDEDSIGYFTKGGDGDVDICPVSLIHKAEVYAMAMAFDEYPMLSIPQGNIDVVPTAGLWDGQTDEKELGMTYDEIAWAIEFLKTHRFRAAVAISTNVKSSGPQTISRRQEIVLSRVRKMQVQNAHKLAYPPVYDPSYSD